MKKKILFVRPDFHSTFFQRNDLEKQGWEAKIFVGWDYPDKLLYSNENTIGLKKLKNSNILFKILNLSINIFEFLFVIKEYSYFIYYSNPPIFSQLDIFKKLYPSFSFELFLLKSFKKKIIFRPTGCHQEMLRKDWIKVDNGNVCSNCGFFEKCNDRINSINFSLIKKYSDLNIGFGMFDSPYYKTSHFKFKSVDPDIFKPDIEIPEEYLLPPTKNLRVLHSSFIKNSGRGILGKDIKGSRYVHNAIEKLKRNGYSIELLYIDDLPSNVMRFYQVQSDIVVDQLIYGHWGSTAIECWALGKPVIGYLNPKWKEFFLKSFPEHKELPLIEANTENIYEIIKNLLDNKSLIKKIGNRSREFVMKQYNSKINSKILIKKLSELK